MPYFTISFARLNGNEPFCSVELRRDISICPTENIRLAFTHTNINGPLYCKGGKSGEVSKAVV